MPSRPPTHKPSPPATSVQHSDRANELRAKRDAYDKTRGTASERGYDERWRKVRHQMLVHHPICQQCNINPAYHVHHVKSLRAGGDRDDPNNMQCLCASCHNRITSQSMHKVKRVQRFNPHLSRGDVKTPESTGGVAEGCDARGGA